MTAQPTQYVKFRWVNQHRGCTAGLIMELDRFKKLSLSEVSRLFPYAEARNMRSLQCSPPYPTWEAAFGHRWSDQDGTP